MVLMLFFNSSMLHAQTLCNVYGSQTPTYIVGVGSPNNITHSSQLGSTVPSGSVVQVVGDFTVNADFTLTSTIVKVNTGAKIFVQSSGFFSLTFLTLNNTRLFACGGLWKGIEMSGFTGISTTNGTQIEDAENAIKSINSDFVSFSISNTIFNRNVIGINLEASTYSWYPPYLTFFIDNTFSCSSPLNGTSNGKTEIGFRMKNINSPLVFNYGNSNNTFIGIKNGISMEACSGMELINYHFQSIDFYSVEFKNGEQLYVKNCDFSDIKRKGIYSQNSRSLRVEDSQFLGSSFNPNPDVSKVRDMIHIRDPKIGNTNLIQRNEFKTFGDLYGVLNHIRFDLTSLSAEVVSSINANTFKQFNNVTGNGEYYSIGIQVNGNYSITSDIDIENNDFIQDANNTGYLGANTAIVVADGDKNNVHIVTNRFKSGRGYTCLMLGSTGIGNEFSNNIVNRGVYNVLSAGVGLKDFQNAKICSNIDNNASDRAFMFTGQNHNTNFIKNIMYGPTGGSGRYSIYFPSTDALIGQQIHKGNEWYPVSCGVGVTCHPSIKSNSFIPTLSQFTVHSPQSNLNTSTGNYNYFSSYFPYFITPNAISSGFWVTDPSGVPPGDCITQGPNPDGLNENLIALNGLSDYLRNPVQQSDAEMYLYRNIKANPNAFNGNRAYNSFLQRNNGKNKDKVTDLEKAIDESGKIKELTKAKIADFKNQIKALEAEAKRYSKMNPASVDVIKAWYKKRLDLDDNINVLYTEHKSEKKIKHQNAKRIIDNVVPVTANERLIKDVYAIYLDAQVNNDGKFTPEQKARLKVIAKTCVTEGGMIVYMARGLLSENDLQEIQGSIDICEPRLSYESAPSVEGIDNSTMTTQQKQSIVRTTAIYPNPAGESFTINVQDNLTGTAQITDITGKILKLYDLQTGTNTIHHDLPKGMYIITIKLSDGKTLTEKLSINY